jgi:DNA-binding transcriptional LysR family regulator
MTLNFRQLEVFRAIMIAKTICGAAELLHVSQPGVSRALKYIEMKLNIELFERRQNGMIPTPEAKELFEEIQPLFKRLDDLNNNINRIVRNENTYLQIGCAPSLAHYVLPVVLARAKKKLPEVIARVDTLSNEELAEYIVERRGDFALSTYDPGHPLILAEPSIIGHIQCVVPKDHPLAKRSTVSINEIAKHSIVSYYEDTLIGRVLLNRFEELDLTPKISVQVRFNDVACAMVEHGLGVGFAYDFASTESLSPNLTVLPIEDDLRPIPVYLLRHQGYSYSNQIRGFYEEIESQLDTLKG